MLELLTADCKASREDQKHTAKQCLPGVPEHNSHNPAAFLEVQPPGLSVKIMVFLFSFRDSILPAPVAKENVLGVPAVTEPTSKPEELLL